MISIFDRRYRVLGKGPVETGKDPCAAILGLSCGLLDSISRYVLIGDSFAPLSKELEQVKDSLLQGDSADRISEAESAVSRILAKYNGDTQQAALVQTMEVQHIFATLNQALIALSEGSGRSVSRLSQVQNALQHTSKMRDIVEMKAVLADTVEFVKKEAAESKKLVTEELERLQTDVGKAREYIANNGSELPGRSEAIEAIGEALRGSVDGCSLYILAFVCARLAAITQRYGSEVTEELVFRVIRERLQPVARTAVVYRWTKSGLVAIFPRQCDLTAVTSEVAALDRGPVVHRVALGNRTAVLTMASSVLVLEGGARPQEELVERLDQFIDAHS